MGHAGNVRRATPADLAIIIGLLADDLLGEVREPGTVAAHACDSHRDEAGAVNPRSGEPQDSTHEKRLAAEGRRAQLGAWYTPETVVEGLLGLALDPLLAARGGDGDAIAALRVLDPACGDGRFLVAAARRIANAMEAAGSGRAEGWTAGARCVTGIDLDPDAAALAREHLSRAVTAQGGSMPEHDRIAVDDALLLDPPLWDPGLDMRPMRIHRGAQWADLLDPDPRSRLAGNEPAGFDLVVGNPPFRGQLKAITRNTASENNDRHHRFGDLASAFTDPAAFFLLLGSELARSGSGIIALVLPIPLLATRDGGAIRRHVLSRADLHHLWVAGERVFDAKVEVCAPVLVRRVTEPLPKVSMFHEPPKRKRRGEPEPRRPGEVPKPNREANPTLIDVAAVETGPSRGPVRLWSGQDFTAGPETRSPTVESPTWSALLATHAGAPERSLVTDGQLSDLAHAAADFRDEYYGLDGHVVDQRFATPGLVEPPLVTVGSIDPAHVRWGERNLRFQKVTYRHPRVRVAGLDDEMQRWANQRLVPKVLVGTQTQVLEAVADVAGELLPSVPIIIIEPRRRDPHTLDRIGALLTSPPVTLVAFRRHAGSGLGGRSLRVGPRELLDLPLPADLACWDVAAASFRVASQADDIEERHVALVACGRAMNEAFGLGPDGPLLRWWMARLPDRRQRLGNPEPEW